MSFRPISSFQDPSLVPGIMVYVDAVQGISNTITCVNVPAAATRDFAKEMLDRIRYLRKMYVTSCGPNSLPPSARAFSDAEAFIRKLPLSRTGTPTINVASDGEVNFDWASGETRIDLGFFGNGTYSFYGHGTGTEVVGEAIPLTDEVPKDLIFLASGPA